VKYQHQCADGGTGATAGDVVNLLCGYNTAGNGAGAAGQVQAEGREAFKERMSGNSLDLRTAMEANIRKHFDIGLNNPDYGVKIVAIRANDATAITEANRNAIATRVARDDGGAYTNSPAGDDWVAGDVTELTFQWQIWSKTSKVGPFTENWNAEDEMTVKDYKNLDGSLAGDILSRLAVGGAAAKGRMRDAALGVLTENQYVMTSGDCGAGGTAANCIGWTLDIPLLSRGTVSGTLGDFELAGGPTPDGDTNLLGLIECTSTTGVFVYGNGVGGGQFDDGCLQEDLQLGTGAGVLQEYRVQYFVRLLNSAFKQVEKKAESLKALSTHSNAIFQAAAKKDILLDKSLEDVGINIVAVYGEGHSTIHFDENT